MALSNNSNSSTVPLLNHNGILLPDDAPLLTAHNRGFRYGDGLFETLLAGNGRIRLAKYHFERLLAGLQQLGFSVPSLFDQQLAREVELLCHKNDHSPARVRITVYRGDGLLFDPADGPPQYIIQSSSLRKEALLFNTEGLTLDIFPDGRKAIDAFSNLKSNNFLLYTMAAHYARKLGVNDCLVLNDKGRLADSTIANLFCIRSGEIYTPPLEEGVVAGVMRRHLLEELPKAGFVVRQEPLTVEDLYAADEVFLTNAIRGINWVRSLGNVSYCNQQSSQIADYFQFSNVL